MSIGGNNCVIQSLTIIVQKKQNVSSDMMVGAGHDTIEPKEPIG